MKVNSMKDVVRLRQEIVAIIDEGKFTPAAIREMEQRFYAMEVYLKKEGLKDELLENEIVRHGVFNALRGVTGI